MNSKNCTNNDFIIVAKIDGSNWEREIECITTPTTVMFAISSSIPENVIKKIFEPYFTTKHKSIGTGIGLSITHQIVTKHHDANITASNETYEYNDKIYTGACFSILFNRNSLK